MLKATTQPQTLNFYGKTNWGEFAWFVIFMGCLGLGVLFTMVFFDMERVYQGHISWVLNPLNFLGYLLIIIITFWILYWGFTMRWEYKEGGKNAINDFWKKFWSGKVPRLVDIRVEQPTVEDYLKQMGRYIEDLSPGEIGDAYVKLKKEFGN